MSPVSAPLQSISAIVSKLEDEGQLPKLDRTDTLLGVDANGDGVRDDIEAFVNNQATTLAQRNAHLNFAKALQKSFTLDITNRQSLQKNGDLVAHAIQCIYRGKFGNYEIIQKIEGFTVNTTLRVKAYLAYNESLNGMVFTSTKGNGCVE